MKSLSTPCRATRTKPSEQDNSCSPIADTNALQAQVYGCHMLAPMVAEFNHHSQGFVTKSSPTGSDRQRVKPDIGRTQSERDGSTTVRFVNCRSNLELPKSFLG